MRYPIIIQKYIVVIKNEIKGVIYFGSREENQGNAQVWRGDGKICNLAG